MSIFFILQSCGHCHDRLPLNKACPYANRTAPQKLPMASFSESVVAANGKPKDYISISCGPLGSESYGKYVIGKQALGQKIKKLQEVDMIKSPEPVAQVGNGGDCHDTQHTNMEKSSLVYCHTSVSQSPCGVANDISGDQSNCNREEDTQKHGISNRCPLGNTGPKWLSNHASECTNHYSHCSNQYRNIDDLDALAFGQRNMKELGLRDSSGPKDRQSAGLRNGEERPAKAENTKRAGKPKVSLLVQLLESERETETNIPVLPRLLDFDENSKEEKKTSNSGQQAGGSNVSYGENAPQSNDTSDNLIDGVLSCSDADKMLNMMSIPDLPDNFFNLNMPDEELDLVCEKAIESIQMATDENELFIGEDQCGQEQQSTLHVSCKNDVSRERGSPDIDIHPHSDGVVDDFPELLSQAPDMASPALTQSLGKMLGRPLNTSSPIPR